MLGRMKSRSLAAGSCVLTLLGISACGESNGTGASTATTTVKLGQTSYVTAAPILTSTTTAGTLAPGAVGGIPGEQIYTVVSGDYPIGIAKKHCIDFATLVAYNAWPEGADHGFFPGDQVKIPSGACAPGSQPESTTAPVVEETPQETTTTFDASTGGTYTVVAGDYLAGIAEKVGTTVDALVAANGWPDGAAHTIIPGQKIKTPVESG